MVKHQKKNRIKKNWVTENEIKELTIGSNVLHVVSFPFMGLRQNKKKQIIWNIILFIVNTGRFSTQNVEYNKNT